MSCLLAVLFGLALGITTFLPVSSFGHLALLQNLFHLTDENPFFYVMVHLGTLIAVLWAYRHDVAEVVRGGFSLIGLGPSRGHTTRKNAARRRMAVFLVIGTLPLLLVLLIWPYMTGLFQKTILVCLMLMAAGLFLFLAERFSTGTKENAEVSAGSAFVVGLSQLLALVPGLSRTGLTISVGMFFGYRRTYAVRFSLLLSIPAILGTLIISFQRALEAGIQGGLWIQYFLCMAAAAVSGYFGIRLVKYLAARSNFRGFAFYSWGVCLVAFILFLIV